MLFGLHDADGPTRAKLVECPKRLSMGSGMLDTPAALRASALVRAACGAGVELPPPPPALLAVVAMDRALSEDEDEAQPQAGTSAPVTTLGPDGHALFADFLHMDDGADDFLDNGADESDEGEGAAYLSEEDLQVRRVAHALFAPCMSHHCSCRAYLRGQPAGS